MPDQKPRQRKGAPPGPPNRNRGVSSLPTPASVARDAPDQDFTWQQAFPWPGVVVMMGDRGSGKTATAYWVMHQWHQHSKGKAVGAVYKAPRGLKAMLPDWVASPQRLANLPENAVCVVDEAQLMANSRRSGSTENLDIGNLVSLGRQRNQLIILISHNSRKLDLNCVMDASRIVWKQPTRGHLLFERREIQPFTARALAAFEGFKGDKRRYGYVLDFKDLRFGKVNTHLAPWWKPEMSIAMAALGQEV